VNNLGQLEVGNELREIIENNGFEINLGKVKLRKYYQRQTVTGIIVNDSKRPNLTRKYKNQIRAMLYSLKKYGHEAAEKEYYERYEKKQRNCTKPKPSFKQILKGKIDYLGMVRGIEDPVYLKFRNQLKELAPELKFPRTQLEKLLYRYEEFERSTSPQQRGYELEKLLNETFLLFNIEMTKSFRRNDGFEQIDGAFKLDGWHYLVECKWTKNPVDSIPVDSLAQKVNRSGDQTMGLFLSINGWSDGVIMNLMRDRVKKIILMDGNDFKMVLLGKVELIMLIKKKIEHLNYRAEPFYSANDLLNFLRSSKNE